MTNPDQSPRLPTDLAMTEVSELLLRQEVLVLRHDAYGWATVVKINDGSGADTTVRVARPYIHTGDFEYTGGVTHYTGVEIFDIRGEVLALPLPKSQVAR